MKRVILSLVVFLILSGLSAQTTCIQDDGTYYYSVKMDIDEVPADFSKDDFIQEVSVNESVSQEDIDFLNAAIIETYKVFPSLDEHESVVLKSNSNLYGMMNAFSNTISSVHCKASDCEIYEDYYKLYALLTVDYLEHSFNQEDFINFLIENEEITDQQIDYFENNIIQLVKFTPFDHQFDFFHRIVVIISTDEMYDILFQFPNAIEFHECAGGCGPENEEDCLLGEETLSVEGIHKKEDAIVYPNPLSNQSVLRLPDGFIGDLQIFDVNGKVLQQTKNLQGTINLNDFSLPKGILFFKISNGYSQQVQTIKVINK